MIDAENFSCYGTGSTGRTNMLAGTSWLAINTACTPSTSGPRGSGTHCLINTAAPATPDGGRLSIGGAYTAYFTGGGFRYDVLPSGNSEIVLFQPRDGANVAQCSLTLSTVGKLELRSGNHAGTVIADTDDLSPVPPITAGSYHFVEMWVQIGNGGSPGDGACIVRVDGRTVLSADSIDTRGGSSGAQIEQYMIHATGENVGARLADLYWSDEGFIGDTQWLDTTPNADTANTGWTRNTGSNDYETIDDTVPDGDTTYIESDTVGQISDFGVTALPAGASSVVAVITKYMARKADAGDGEVRSCAVSTLDSPNTVANGMSRQMTESYAYYRDVFPVDPATGVAWTVPAAEAFNLRFEKMV